MCPVISPSRDSDDKESESDSDSDYEDEHSKEDGHDHWDNDITDNEVFFGQFTLQPATLRTLSHAMSISQSMMRIINEKVVYLFKITDQIGSKLEVLPQDLKIVDDTFSVWQTQLKRFFFYFYWQQINNINTQQKVKEWISK